ncbi:hypothetical protein [Aquimarina aquimarini]|uniref:hypothetical protein n=1 Tax=Aquimarina aquimarini TaxID=1191734 RepID=UPI000D55E7F1|nr:hypothetical protein [Aquimarina aquimarini]
MKRTIIILLVVVLLGIHISKGQERDCSNTKIYNLVFQEMQLYKKKAVEIKIGYEPSKFVIESIGIMDIFDPTEMEQFKSLPEDIDYLSCTKLKSQIELMLSDDLIRENGSYIVHFFSQIISLSDSKKCVLNKTAIGNKNYQGGKIIGHEIIYIFSLIDDKWVLIDKKSVGMS